MSGFEALGAAAAIIQLVESGIKYGSKAIAIYESASGLDKDFRSLDQVNEEFRARNRDLLDGYLSRSNTIQADDDGLRDIALQCENCAAKLAALIEDVRMKDRTKWKAVVHLWKSESKRKKIESLQGELSRWRRECQDHLLKMIFEGQFTLANTLQEISQRQKDSQTALSKQVMSLRRDLLHELRNKSDKRTPHLVQLLLNTQNTGGCLLPREDILHSLLFEEIQLRRDRIARPTESTYRWMFDEAANKGPPVRFVQWLEEDTDTYWITGKAGSGKSTLMKFIQGHATTEASLRKWANNRELYIADYYFWYRGGSLQKSHEGLLRSILYNILEQCPSLTEQVCIRRWKSAANGRDTRRMPWSIEELQECAAALAEFQLSVEGQEICFCFFIDGLDECSDDVEDVIATIERLAAGPHIKVCASSRPWNKFKFAFQEVRQRGDSIEVHEHTTKDIETVIDAELDPVLKKVGKDRSELGFLVSEIIHMSQGVFLWVILVLRRELIPMLKSYESTSKLHSRLKDIPDDLIEYFEQIFRNVWKETKFPKETAKIFRTCITAKHPVPLACLEVIVVDDPEQYVHEAANHQSYTWGDPQSIKAATAQINARCLDLLCVEPMQSGTNAVSKGPDHPLGLHRIEFLHRTVADFLVGNNVAQDLEKYAGADFDPSTTLFACYAFLVQKCLSFDPDYIADTRRMAMEWCTTSLLYCPATSALTTTATLVDDIDRSMTQLFASIGSAHWTNYMVSVQTEAMSGAMFNLIPPKFLAESAGRDLIGHLIELRITDNVKTRLTSVSESSTQKKGRPYLDYALRHDPGAEFRYTSKGLFPEKITYDTELVELLLSQGADVNQQVWIYNGRTVWDLFLAFLYDYQSLLHSPSALAVTRLLVEAGAKNVPRCVISQESEEATAKYQEKIPRRKDLSMQQILESVFGPEQGSQLYAEATESNTTRWLSWLRLR